jgi:hypothetical protein
MTWPVERRADVEEKLSQIEQRASLLDREHCRAITRRLNEIRDILEASDSQMCNKCGSTEDVELYALETVCLCRKCRPEQRTVGEVSDR